MAYNEEASPICRGKNLSWETVLLFYNSMPRTALPKATFHSYVESRINGWTQTHSQIARQLAFYYEQDGMCYPRFTEETTYSDLFLYMQNWASKYFVPNPYSPSLKEYEPVCLYLFLKNSIEAGNTDFDAALDSIFGVKLSSHDKVNVYLSNFTNIVIDGNHNMRLNDRIYFPEVRQNILNDHVSDVKKYFEYFDSFTTQAKQDKSKVKIASSPRQIIYYGAPGTGKSNKIEEQTNDDNRIRTTFHPDSDYSTFVGAYKPTMKKQKVYEASGSVREEERISYSFVPQAFLKAYVEAWKRKNEGDESPYYLVIEEINRGNCAQIFGDLFQLLDRNDEGSSRYAIVPDDDIRRHLEKELANCTNLPEKIMKGEEMRLPSNLYIWATMNTSDQSLFPIDSAFKRRWDWEYMPIENGGRGFVIDIAGTQYDWWNFISDINEKIDRITGSEDKKLGYWFAKPAAGGRKIDCQQFVSKVLFYLWNDVYKDYADSKDSIFRADNNGQSIKTPFTTFFGSGREERIKAFMAYNHIEPVVVKEDSEEDELDKEEFSNAEFDPNMNESERHAAWKEKWSNFWKPVIEQQKSNGIDLNSSYGNRAVFDYRFGKSGIIIRQAANDRGENLWIGIYISSGYGDKYYPMLQAKKIQLESKLAGFNLKWVEDKGNYRSVQVAQTIGAFKNSANFSAAQNWFVETAKKVVPVFQSVIEEIIREG